MRVRLEVPTMHRAEEYIAAVKRSRTLHRTRTTPPNTFEKYISWLDRFTSETQEHFFVVIRETDELAGVIDIGSISRGLFQSAYLGYYALAPHAGKGLMREGLVLTINYAFRELRLHRLEANIQPDNARSIALVKGLGFRKEGYSTRYLKIAGRWRDHERWAILREEWRPSG